MTDFAITQLLNLLQALTSEEIDQGYGGHSLFEGAPVSYQQMVDVLMPQLYNYYQTAVQNLSTQMEIFEKLLQVFSILGQLGQLCNFDFTNLLITRYNMIMNSIMFADTALVKSSELPQFASGMIFVSTLIPTCD